MAEESASKGRRFPLTYGLPSMRHLHPEVVPGLIARWKRLLVRLNAVFESTALINDRELDRNHELSITVYTQWCTLFSYT